MVLDDGLRCCVSSTKYVQKVALTFHLQPVVDTVAFTEGAKASLKLCHNSSNLKLLGGEYPLHLPPVWHYLERPFTYYIMQGGEDLLISVRKCDKGWVGCFWSVKSHFLKQLNIKHILPQNSRSGPF